MTLNEAFATATKEWSSPCGFTPSEAAEWAEAENVLVGHGYCPHCACEGERVKLCDWERGNHENYAGRECPQCESFIVCGEQDTAGYLQPWELDVDASGMCYSDADSGL